MTQLEDDIRSRLSALGPSSVEIIDESHRHSGHAGAREGGRHYALAIVSSQFAGKSTIERHRMVYSAIGELMKHRIHALTIRALAPSEL
jgi:BolA protein